MPDSLEGYSPEEIAQMAATYKAILDNPETRELGLRATKHLNPKASIPELDMKVQVAGALKVERDAREKLERDLMERDARDRINGERATLRDQGFDKDQIAAIEKIMVDEQIPSYATAAKFYKSQQTVAEPTPRVQDRALTYSMPTDALGALKAGKAGLNKWGREAAAQALDEIRSGRIKLQ